MPSCISQKDYEQIGNHDENYGITIDEGYTSLHEVLIDAFLQAQSGKGKERHADHALNEAFEDQPICAISRRTGLGGPAFQASKKILEAMAMAERGDMNASIRELYGAINYVAAMVILVKDGRVRHLNNDPCEVK